MRARGRTVVVVEFEEARANAASDAGYLTCSCKPDATRPWARCELEMASAMFVLVRIPTAS